MNADEKRRIETLENRFEVMEKMVEDIHRALLEVPLGEKLSRLERISRFVEFGEKGEWLAGWTIKGILTMGALVAASSALWSWFWQWWGAK